MAIAFVFPGQGSQSVAMLAAYAEHPAVAAAVEEAGDAIDVDLAALIQNEEAVRQTENTQPAMLAMGVGVFRAAAPYLPVAVAMAGHSLGEYAALVCAGAVDFAVATRLVRRRGIAMQQAASDDAGMIAIIGIGVDIVDNCCDETRQDGGQVWAVNYNSPQQTVIAGDKKSLDDCCRRAKAQGAKRFVEVPMSVPSHCPLLAPAAASMTEALSAANWSQPSPPVIHNATVQEEKDIASALQTQLTQPVRWTETINCFAARGISRIYECGPGRVLSGLGKRINADLPHVPLASSSDIGAL
ncbi:ACP S-malonyltransferase [Candidatus Persebacteraceae bacterium Df01]|uniref:Malonyl CoA-acyl carrier protein transacylase n=1 Tax=Candidatus Doriopsillibacter californiensis TaxID=2970740 RepID=A0ABT7QKU7_9GAMM|nr:ACP S-malonyltransferase [Candidatus Persebacteraceae bacterium Df01]